MITTRFFYLALILLTKRKYHKLNWFRQKSHDYLIECEATAITDYLHLVGDVVKWFHSASIYRRLGASLWNSYKSSLICLSEFFVKLIELLIGHLCIWIFLFLIFFAYFPIFFFNFQLDWLADSVIDLKPMSLKRFEYVWVCIFVAIELINIDFRIKQSHSSLCLHYFFFFSKCNYFVPRNGNSIAICIGIVFDRICTGSRLTICVYILTWQIETTVFMRNGKWIPTNIGTPMCMCIVKYTRVHFTRHTRARASFTPSQNNEINKNERTIKKKWSENVFCVWVAKTLTFLAKGTYMTRIDSGISVTCVYIWRCCKWVQRKRRRWPTPQLRWR